MSAPVPARTYYLVFFALLGLLALTVAAALIPYGRWNLRALGVTAALAIAWVKAALVAAYFMHLRWSGPLPRIFAAMGVVWLLILFALTLDDYLTRSWFEATRGWVEEAPAGPGG